MIQWLVRLIVLAVLFTPTMALAHGFEPAIVDVRELRRNLFATQWRNAPGDAVADAQTRLEMPSHCKRVEVTQAHDALYDCTPDGLANASLGISFAETTQHEVILRLHPLDAPMRVYVLRRESPRVQWLDPPQPPRRWHTLWTFVSLGVRHLVTGYDHVLFLLALCVWIQRFRARIGVLTAFTLGHSLTLALQTLRIVHVAPQWVEAWIAATLVQLAVTLSLRDSMQENSPREAVAVAGACGLIHGLGFASALEDVGLPDGQRGWALAGFNVGVELGQIACVALLTCVEWLGSGIHDQWKTRVRRALIHVVGAVGIALLIDRVLAFRTIT